jgi:hypothetical protein
MFEKTRIHLNSANPHNTKQVIDTYISKIIIYLNEAVVQFSCFPNICLEPEDKEETALQMNVLQTFI